MRMLDNLLFFFFSSRRRHTRCSRDWSSDVCSSDLPGQRPLAQTFGEVLIWATWHFCDLVLCPKSWRNALGKAFLGRSTPWKVAELRRAFISEAATGGMDQPNVARDWRSMPADTALSAGSD